MEYVRVLSWTPKGANRVVIISRECERATRDTVVEMHPINTKILLLPKDNIHLSLNIPTIGCPIEPDNGPANHTSDSTRFEMWSDKRNGVASENSVDHASCNAPRISVKMIMYSDDLCGLYRCCLCSGTGNLVSIDIVTNRITFEFG